jgi:hypothetical protein
MKWLLAGLAVLVALIVVVVLVGLLLPRDHVSSRAARYQQSPSEIWSAITDYSKFPEWRKNIRQVDLLPSADGKPSWREIDSRGHAIPYEIAQSHPPERLVTRIANPKLPFGGTWTYDISPTPGGGTMLRITENGEIYNPVFRFVERFFLGYTQNQDQYLRFLGQKFGETVTIQN